MRLAVVVPGGVDRSGERRVIPALLALLARLAQRHDVQVFALRQEERPGRWPLVGCVVHNLALRGRRDLPRAIGAIASEHRREPFDLVQAIWSGEPGLVAVLAARWIGVPSCVHLAGGELVGLKSIGYGGRLHWRGRLREALVLRSASALSAACAPMLAQLAALGHHDAIRIPLGVDLQAWAPLPPRRRADGEPLQLVHVASLNRVKDQPTLLRAMARLAAAGVDFRLDVIGEDTLGGRVQALSEQLGLAERVRFHGFATQAALRPRIAAAHLLVMSSLHEAGPVVLLEAALLGVPCVGTHVGHLVEWQPEAAVTVAVGDAQRMADEIAALAGDEDRRMGLAIAAQRRAGAEDAELSAALFEALHRRCSAAAGR